MYHFLWMESPSHTPYIQRSLSDPLTLRKECTGEGILTHLWQVLSWP